MPQIYSLEDYNQTKPSKFEKIKLEEGGYYFFSKGELCMYSNSPCTHVKHNGISFSKILNNYKLYYKN